MPLVRRLSALTLIVIVAVYVAWLGFQVQTMGDYPKDFAPGMNALLSGHLGAFFALLPEDGAGGSILLRLPGAIVGKLVSGSQLAIFRFGALECLLVLGALGVWVASTTRALRRSPLAPLVAVALCLLTPAILDVIRFGHPEEALGAALCVGAVLLASDGRANLAGAALGLAVVNKPWGVLAIAPVLLASREGRARTGGVAVMIAGSWYASVWLANPSSFAYTLGGTVAHPPDVWWPLAHLSAPPGVTPAYFVPSVIAGHARELAVVAGLVVSIPLARNRARAPDDCLALLALVLLLRCVLDPSNHVYYQLPCVIALAAWDARTRAMPSVALLAVVGFYLTFHTIASTGSLAAQFAVYMAVVAALAAILARPATGRRPRTRRLAAVAGYGPAS